MDPGSNLLATATAGWLAQTPACGGERSSLVAKRRSKGAGSVFRRADGRWSGSVDLGGALGGNRRKVVYGDSRKVVEERVRRLVNDVADGSPPPSRSPQLGAFLNQWLIAVRPTLRPKTYVSYEGIVRLHLVPELGRVALEKLSIDHVANLVNNKQADRRLSPTTVRYVLLILRNALGKAVRWGLVGRNVATLVDPPRVGHKDVRVLSPEETKKLLDAARGEPIEGLIVLAVSTGVRLGEALGLQWHDIDLERRQLRISRSLQRVSGQGQVLTETKTLRSRRTIVLPVRTAEALRALRARQGEWQRAAGSAWHKGNFVFTSSTGNPLDQRNVLRMFKRVLRKAKLPRMRFHDLRHSCASLLLAQHISPRVVMETLGHSRISVTMDTYTHVMPALMRDAADAMDRSLDSANERE
jgi:integrase